MKSVKQKPLEENSSPTHQTYELSLGMDDLLQTEDTAEADTEKPAEAETESKPRNKIDFFRE